MTRRKGTLANYGGLADLGKARGKGREETSAAKPAEQPQAQEQPVAETQVSAFLERGLYKRVKLALIEDEITFRDLLATLLERWLRER